MFRSATIFVSVFSAAITCASPRVLLAQNTPPLCSGGPKGCFRGLNGRLRDADSAYKAMIDTRDPSYIRASIEMGVALGLGALWYWLDREHNLADWDFPSLKQRLTFEAWRYDNNSFAINWTNHPFSGAAYYALARGNEISVPWSAAYSVVTSMLWEYVLEFREKVSINDVLVTPCAGVAIGEFGHKLAVYLNSAPSQGRGVLQTLRWTLGLTVAGHRALDGKTAPNPVETDALGLDADMWHQFRLGYRLNLPMHSAHSQPLLYAFYAEGELVSIPGLLREGRFSRVLQDADFTSFALMVQASEHDTGLDLYADTTLLGYYRQDIRARGPQLWGYGFLVGSSLGYRYLNQGVPYRDRLALLHLPGLATNAYWRSGRLELRLKARGHFDFAGVHAHAFAQWRDANPAEEPKSILKKQGYYYGWGGSGRVTAELRLWPFELGGRVFLGVYDSNEGLDRTQESVTVDVKASDTVIEYRGWLRLEVPGTTLRIELGLNGRRGSSKVGRFRDRIRDDRYTVGVMSQL